MLHLLRYRARNCRALLAQINATGYALTLGVHTRIDETVAQVADGLRAGNLYVNRNIVGAVVGVQPFGGDGLSGTGPKAGGPLYLLRLFRGKNAPRLEGGVVPVTFDALAALRAALPRLCDLTDDQRRLLVARLDTYRDQSPLRVKLTLPGPTGERNTLQFLPRGTVGCHADALPYLLEQLAAAWATGNRALLPDTVEGRRLVRVIDHPNVAFVRDVVDADIQALLYAGDEAAADPLRRRLAARDGPLVPLISERESGGYDLHRLVLEKTVSVNTTAAGGNAALMSLPG